MQVGGQGIYPFQGTKSMLRFNRQPIHYEILMGNAIGIDKSLN